MFRSTSERRRRRLLPLALVAVLALLGAGCGGDDSGDDSGTGNGSGDDVVTAGFIYIGPINDGGWTQAHEAGRADAAETLGDTAELTYKENVPEGPEAAQAMRDMIADGADIIFANSFGYGDAIKEVAAEHPDVKFEHATGLDTGGLPNVATYFGASEDTIYLTGIAAGAAIPEGGTVGFVAPFAIPEVIRHINAFQVGVAEVNPTATTKVVWTNTWFDPETERQAAGVGQRLLGGQRVILGAAHVAVGARDRVVPGEAHAAPVLQAGVGQFARQPTGLQLRHRGQPRDVLAGDILLDRAPGQRAEQFDLGA